MEVVNNDLEQMKVSVAVSADIKKRSRWIEQIGKYIHIISGVSQDKTNKFNNGIESK